MKINNNVLQTYVVQDVRDKRADFPAKSAFWFPFMRDLSDSQDDQKKYKVSDVCFSSLFIL